MGIKELAAKRPSVAAPALARATILDCLLDRPEGRILLLADAVALALRAWPREAVASSVETLLNTGPAFKLDASSFADSLEKCVSEEGERSIEGALDDPFRCSLLSRSRMSTSRPSARAFLIN